ncbi:hypothetical protein GF352_02180 [archaeon]|nr:hypothetical protein [archaeon]
MRRTIILGLIVLSLGTVFAEEQVMLVSDLNTPDLFAATAAGAYEGVPVITLSNGALDENVTAVLEEADPAEVILVGGPVVIDEGVEEEIEDLGYTVVRLWGIERTKTALELAKYFWHQANCAVLVEDTGSPENDSTLQAEALNEASLNNCPLIPVPRGVIPADLLSILHELKINRVKYIGRQISSEVRSELQDFNLTEIIGNLTRIRNRVIARALDKANAMVIVASPQWNETHSMGAALNNNSVVRRVVSMDDVPEIIDLIQANNISPVKVVGNPSLANNVVSELRDNGITVVKYAGAKPAIAARKLWQAERNRFNARKTIRRAVKTGLTSTIRNRVRELLNNTESAIDELEAEIEELSSEGADTSELEEKLAEARELLDQAQGNITMDSELAQRLLNKALNKVKQRLWVRRQVINWDWVEELRDEVQSAAQIMNRLRISAVEENLSAYTNACGNAEAIQDLVNKAKDLRDEAANETDRAKKAALLREAKDNIDHAKRLGRICLVRKSIPQRLRNAVTSKIRRVNVKKAASILRRLRNN